MCAIMSLKKKLTPVTTHTVLFLISSLNSTLRGGVFFVYNRGRFHTEGVKR